jgi:phospholipid transport system transporter-binding protein
VIEQANNQLTLVGRLTLDSVAQHHALPVLTGAHTVVDLAQVEAVDSSAVSLLLSWVRQAQARQITLSFVNAPSNLHSLVSLYGLSEMLPLNPA